MDSSCDSKLGRSRAARRCGLAAVIALALASCAGSGKGACDGFSPDDGHRWCVDDMTPDECKDFDQRHVNGASWQLWEDQTCAERGCATGGPC